MRSLPFNPLQDMKHTILTLAVTSLLATTAFADPIHVQAASGNLAGVQAELDKGVDVNVVDISFYNLAPLHYAAGNGYKEIVELLIAEGADVDAKSTTGGTPLFNAVGSHKEITELLLAAGADVNAQVVPGPHGFTVGDTALDFTNLSEIIDILRKHGGKTGEELRSGITPLHHAARDGHKETVELLIANGANVNAKMKEGTTPLHFAASKGHKEIAELLIAKDADVNAIAGKELQSKTPLDEAIKTKRTETADLLRAHGGKTREELNALIDAAKNGDIEAVKQHLAAGADVNAKTGDGTTPLHNAAIYGHNEVAELLIANGASVNAIIVSGRNQGKTPLDLAIWRKKTETADLLRKHGGRTAEELALMPQLVYSKGPFDFSFTAKDGKTYVIEVTQDLKQWGELETIEGIGKQVKFIDPRQPLVPFKRNFYRVKLVE
jgi:ankyrin repeat protein